ncbi:MAG: hypothetical protein RBR34_08135 [Rhodospirillaceae bacterium]|nr:hypothetical protein [Rhodospirillaceae bacterium]
MINHEKTDRKVLTVPKEMSARISRYRFGREIGTESEALRNLIGKGLEAFETEKETANA